MTTLRDEIARAITEIPVADDDDGGPDDEIVAAIERQLAVLEGTAVVLGNMTQMLVMQIANLRAEVALFRQPAQETQVQVADEVVMRASGAVVEASLPEAKRLPDYCSHPSALIVDTVDGPQRVCPDCDDATDVAD